jgi:hypothetical protein
MNHYKNATFLALLACTGIVLGADAPEANLQVTMLTQVNPQGLALWDITNAAQDADGNFDGSKVTAATWARIAEIGAALEQGGHTLAANGRIIAAPAGAKLQDEDTPGASKAPDVQRHLDAKPAVFRSHALELQKTGTAVAAAAKKHDAKAIGELANSLDGVCEGCHLAFWYPSQKK